MTLPLSAAAIMAVGLAWELARPRLRASLPGRARALVSRWVGRAAPATVEDPGRERRAELRARQLLRSCVNEEEWAMYRDLGFLSVPGAASTCAYLVYPHRPIVAYAPGTGSVLNEYCVAFPDETRPYGSARLPDADDVLAKWMALSADERRVIAEANMHLPGRQVDVRRVRKDLVRLARWERARAAGSVRAA